MKRERLRKGLRGVGERKGRKWVGFVRKEEKLLRK